MLYILRTCAPIENRLKPVCAICSAILVQHTQSLKRKYTIGSHKRKHKPYLYLYLSEMLVLGKNQKLTFAYCCNIAHNSAPHWIFPSWIHNITSHERPTYVILHSIPIRRCICCVSVVFYDRHGVLSFLIVEWTISRKRKVRNIK